MPKLTCPECDTAFNTAGGRYTGCPGCGVRLDARDPDDPVAVGRPTRSPKTTSPYDTDLADVKPKKPVKRYSGPIVVRKQNDGTPKAILALILVGVVGAFGLFAGIAVIVYHVAGSDRPKMATNSPPPPTGQGVGNSFAPGGNPGGPGGGGNGFPGGGGMIGNGGPPAGPGGSFPTPKGNLPGVDPGELPQIGTEIDDDDLAGLFPPGTFPPGTFPGRPAGPGGPGRPGMPGDPRGPRRGPPAGMFPGGPGGPNMPGGPGAAAPAAIAIVTLSNLREVQGVAGVPELHVDFEYAVGSPPGQSDTLVLKSVNGTAQVRLHFQGQSKGTIKVAGIGVGVGTLEAWMERKTSPSPFAAGQKISNSVTK